MKRKKRYQLAGLIQTSHQSSSFDQYLELSPVFLLREKDRDARHLHLKHGDQGQVYYFKTVGGQKKNQFVSNQNPTRRSHLLLLCFPTQPRHSAPSPEVLPPCRACAGCPPPSRRVCPGHPIWLTSETRRCPQEQPTFTYLRRKAVFCVKPFQPQLHRRAETFGAETGNTD